MLSLDNSCLTIVTIIEKNSIHPTDWKAIRNFLLKHFLKKHGKIYANNIYLFISIKLILFTLSRLYSLEHYLYHYQWSIGLVTWSMPLIPRRLRPPVTSSTICWRSNNWLVYRFWCWGTNGTYRTLSTNTGSLNGCKTHVHTHTYMKILS